LSITHNGNFLYTIDASEDKINGFYINDTTGELTLLANVPITRNGNGL